jgi:hypothetical protein
MRSSTTFIQSSLKRVRRVIKSPVLSIAAQTMSIINLLMLIVILLAVLLVLCPFDDAHSSLCTGGRYCWQDTAVKDGHEGSWSIFDTQHLANTSISQPQANPHMYDEH